MVDKDLRLAVFKVFFHVFALMAIVAAGVAGLYSQAFAESNFSNQSEKQYGLPKGEKVPDTLMGLDKSGKEVPLMSMAGDKGMVLLFVRSVMWCKYGRFFLEDVARKGEMIEDTGYKIVVVSNDGLTNIERFYDNERFPYALVADEKSDIIKTFGLMNTSYLPGTIYYGVAHPAIYVVGKDGTIQDKFFNVDIKVMKSVEDIRDALYDVLDQHEGALGTVTPSVAQ